MFGFIPQDFDLAKETVDLVSEQAAAFYDYRKSACSFWIPLPKVASSGSPWCMNWLMRSPISIIHWESI